MPHVIAALDIVDWRRRVFDMYREVREIAVEDPAQAHVFWRATRNTLFAHHPASPLPIEERTLFTDLPCGQYNPAYRFEVEIMRVDPAQEPTSTSHVPRSILGVVGTAAETVEGPAPFDLLGRVTLPGLGTLDVWSLRTYGGGIFLPVKDALAGTQTYGGGRYVLDTIKGAYLGEVPSRGLVVDLNFAYNPSCMYDPVWPCPLAPWGNVLDVELPVGELLPARSATH